MPPLSKFLFDYFLTNGISLFMTLLLPALLYIALSMRAENFKFRDSLIIFYVNAIIFILVILFFGITHLPVQLFLPL